MDLYIFCVVLGAAGMAAMAFLGFASSHGGGRHTHATAGHEMHGIGGSHGHSAASHHTVTHYPVAHGHGKMIGAPVHQSWTSHVLSWLSPRVLFNFLVGFGATGLVIERLVGPVLALPIAVLG